MLHPIWFCTDCKMLKKRSLGLYGLSLNSQDFFFRSFIFPLGLRLCVETRKLLLYDHGLSK